MGSADTPLNRVQETGWSSAAAIDLLAICLSRRPDDTEANQAEARRLFQRYGLARLSDLSVADLKEVAGLEGFEAIRILSAIELGRKAENASKGEVDNITSYSGAKEFFRRLLKNASVERFFAVYLDIKNQVIQTQEINRGTLSSSVVGVREVMREALRCNAARIIVGHNHPSGDPEPSPADIDVTEKLREAAALLDLELLDHIIVGTTCISLKERGYL